MFYRLTTKADDLGRFDARTQIIKGNAFPLKNYGEKLILKWLDELVAAGLVIIYSVDNRPYGAFITWKIHQRIRKIKPKYPEPENDQAQSAALCGGLPHSAASRARPHPRPESYPIQSYPNPKETPNGVSCTEPEASDSIPAELKGLNLYEIDSKLCEKLPTLMPAWKDAFPGVDIVAEIKKAHAWELANPTKQKKNRARFLQNWLTRAQDRPKGGQDGKGGKDIGRSFAAADGDAEKFGGK